MDIDSFERLYVANRQSLEWASMQFHRDKHTAADLLQEACLRAIKSAHQFDDTTDTVDSDFMAWMYRIMRNTWVNWLRKSHRKETTSVPNGHHALALAQDHPRIGNQLFLQDIFRFLKKTEYGKTLEMYVNGFKYEEICEILDIPKGTVKSRINKARAKLRSYLDGDDDVIIEDIEGI